MARIPQDELERLKREVDLEALVREAGVELKGTGDNLLGLCPFHDDRNPSLVVTTVEEPVGVQGRVLGRRVGGRLGDADRGRGLPACGGDPARAARRVAGGRRLSGRAPAACLAAGAGGAGRGAARAGGGLLPRGARAVAVGEDVPRGTGDRGPRGLSGLQARIRRPHAGAADPAAKHGTGVEIRDQLQRVGICRSTGHEHFRGCVVVPVFDAEGRVAEIYGRRVERARSAPPHLYLPGPHRGVFNLDAFRASKEVILCESLIDALTFWCAGFRNVTSSYGTNGFTDEHLEAFNAYGIERVLIAYDRDDAGDAAAKKVAERLAAEGISCWRVLFPRGMDANDYALKVTPASQSLGVLLRSAEHLAGPVVTRSSQNRPATQHPSRARRRLGHHKTSAIASFSCLAPCPRPT